MSEEGHDGLDILGLADNPETVSEVDLRVGVSHRDTAVGVHHAGDDELPVHQIADILDAAALDDLVGELHGDLFGEFLFVGEFGEPLVLLFEVDAQGVSDEDHREDDAVEAQCVYGKSKLEGEDNIIACCSKYLIVRSSWIFGRYGNNFVKTMLRLAGKYDAVSVVSDQKGNPTPARALAEALCIMTHEALKPDFKDYGIYHFAGNPAITWDEFARSVFKYAKLAGFIQKDMVVKSILAKDYPSKAVRPYDSRLDTNKINEVFKIDLPDWHDYLPETVGEFFDEQNN